MKPSAKKRRAPLQKLLDVMKTLRSEKGCPWDREQTHESLKPFLIEECAELLDAIDDGDKDAVLEELGDILLHVVFHAQIADEGGRFDFADIIETIVAKLVRRHPHVFGSAKADDPEKVLHLWKQIKKEEKRSKGIVRKSLLDGIPRHLPALKRAEDLQRRAAKVGFDWQRPRQIIAKIEEELKELKAALNKGRRRMIEDEIGDLLFSTVNLSRFLKTASAEELLARTNAKFARRFNYIEDRLREKGRTPETSTIEEMDCLWNESKKKAPGKQAISRS